MENGLGGAQMKIFQYAFRVRAGKADPAVFPGLHGVGAVKGRLSGNDEKAIAPPKLVGDAVPRKAAVSGKDKVDQIVAAHRGAKAVRRRALLVSAVVNAEMGIFFR